MERLRKLADRRVPMLARMFEKRLVGYRSMGYSIAAAESADLATAQPRADYRVEYDADRLVDMRDAADPN